MIYKENSVYNLYLKVDDTATNENLPMSSDPASGPKDEVVCTLAKSTGSASSDSWKTIAGKKKTKNGGQDSRP